MFIKTYKTYKKKSERYPKQLLYFVSQHKRKTKCIVDKCSDLTCTKKYALTKGPKRGGGGLMWATRSAPPVILCLLRACFPPITLFLILQWHTEVCEETFNVNRKIAQTTQNIWNFIMRESNLQEMANFRDHPGDFRL